MTSAYHALPQDLGKLPVKSSCCGISRRKIIGFIAFLVVVCIVTLYILYNSYDRKVKIEDIGVDFTHSKYNKARHRLPQSIIIGMRKSGTRALLEYLSLHPDVQSAGKEIHYFDKQQKYFQGLRWYKKQFPLSYGDQITIEKTPGYFHSKDAPERIFKMNSTIKLILIVREPVDRAVSDHIQLMEKKAKKGLETKSFEEVALDDDGEVNTNNNAIQRSVYHVFMKRWLKFFTLDQILIIDGQRLIKNPFEVVQTVESYLGLEHKIKKDWFVFDRTKGFFCIKNETTGHRCLSKSKGRKHPNIDKEILEKLKDYYEPHNKIFFEQIGRTFKW